jgi:tetratricopeptide (TPR) repeat protein
MDFRISSLTPRKPLIALLLWPILAANAWAQSEYYRVHLLAGTPAIGRLGEMTKDKVRLDLSSGSKEFAVNDIKYVQLPTEPRELMEARNFALDGKNDQVLTTLDKIPPPLLANEVIRTDVDYYRALSNARLAINHAGDARAAGTALVAFINANKTSYHFYEANETAGDLLVTIGRYDQAVPYFQELASAPWPDYKMRAAVDIGRAYQMQGKHDDAVRQFDAAIATDAKGKAADIQLLAAKVGKAKSLTELGKAKDGVQVLQEIVEQAPPDQFQVLAQAYNGLGNAFVKLKQPKDALDAYLHVTLIYNQSPDQHAEALFHLKDLWKQLNKPENAKQAAELLKARYPGSPWNK